MARLRYSLKNKAFSLLEVIITVSILSIGIVIILEAFSFSARVTGLSCDITRAVFLSEDKIQKLEFKERRNQVTNEQQSGKNDKFIWSYSIGLEPAHSALRLYKLDFNISWERLSRQERINLTTYLKNLR